MRIKDIYHTGVQRLERGSIPDSQLEVGILLGHLLNMSHAQLLLNSDLQVSPACVKPFEEYINRRLRHEPSPYIIGEREFWSLPFLVTADVLIPRPETEFLIETILGVLSEQKNNLQGPVLDLGTGCGVIAIILALELPHLLIHGIDYSISALKIASENAKKHQVEGRVNFINSNWFSGISPHQHFELIVSNPPYVANELFHESSDKAGGLLQAEVRLYEPRIALDGGSDGMESIKSIAAQLSTMLKPGGWFFMEIGAEQSGFVMNLFQSLNEFKRLVVYKDYAGLPRVFQAQRTRM